LRAVSIPVHYKPILKCLIFGYPYLRTTVCFDLQRSPSGGLRIYVIELSIKHLKHGDVISLHFVFQNRGSRIKCRLMRSPCCLSYPPINFLIPEPIFMKLRMYIMAPGPIVLHKSFPSCVCLNVARQRLGKNVFAATNTCTTTEELLDASFSMRSASYQRKVGD
jgi:hypothetical protein